mmetsp:Transcript_59867/g.178141  ORF Transcript_59867/g.178141 Transcript_59867/m.178141 type:complete len:283 (-) Transcript_59867:48-896(-)
MPRTGTSSSRSMTVQSQSTAVQSAPRLSLVNHRPASGSIRTVSKASSNSASHLQPWRYAISRTSLRATRCPWMPKRPSAQHAGPTRPSRTSRSQSCLELLRPVIRLQPCPKTTTRQSVATSATPTIAAQAATVSSRGMQPKSGEPGGPSAGRPMCMCAWMASMWRRTTPMSTAHRTHPTPGGAAPPVPSSTSSSPPAQSARSRWSARSLSSPAFSCRTAASMMVAWRSAARGRPTCSSFCSRSPTMSSSAAVQRSTWRRVTGTPALRRSSRMSGSSSRATTK